MTFEFDIKKVQMDCNREERSLRNWAHIFTNLFNYSFILIVMIELPTVSVCWIRVILAAAMNKSPNCKVLTKFNFNLTHEIVPC